MEDLERRAWDLSRRWLGFTAAPSVQWPRDFNIADVEQELKILADMQTTAMPTEVVAAQQKRVVSVQFGGLEQEDQDRINGAIDERTLAVR
jgi:FKBP-type peptidyl-prolyl cis-trans isomerase (trigger factor)